MLTLSRGRRLLIKNLIKESYKESLSLNLKGYRESVVAEKIGGYMGDPLITGEHEIDVGLRPRQLRERFVKGPLLFRELSLVARMPGKALALWLLILHRSDLSRGKWVTLPSQLLAEFGIHKRAKAVALRHLDAAGLIKVQRPDGYMIKVKPVRMRSRR